MTIQEIRKILKRGEDISVEFKTAKSGIPQSLYETACAFLNRNGGNLLLGIEDNGSVSGIKKELIPKIKKDLVNSLNNPQLLNPPVYVIPDEFEIEKKIIIFLHFPESSQVHRSRGKIYDRNEDGDFDITENTNLVANLFIRKQNTFTENTVYPYLDISGLRKDLIHKVRQMAVNRFPGHPWEFLSDIELLKSSQLYKMDYQTGKEGFTLAAILLFGKDDVILSALPYHRTDALLQVADTDRYDDRDDIRTNLIESYERLLAFIEKHLPDKFVLQDGIRISARNIIFREVISNMLMHREFTNPYPSRLIIVKEAVISENPNKPKGLGIIRPENSVPYPKNPVIGRIFKEIGRADELGSGVRSLFNLYKQLSDKAPILEEKDIFTCTVYIDKMPEFHKNSNGGISGGLNGGINGGLNILLKYIEDNPGNRANIISKAMNVPPKTIEKWLARLTEEKKIEFRGSKKTGGYWKKLI